MVQSVDNKIKKSLARAENPISGNTTRMDQNAILSSKYAEDPSTKGKIRGAAHMELS
jgi:hypothetical protein